jgi:hypothetical protein
MEEKIFTTLFLMQASAEELGQLVSSLFSTRFEMIEMYEAIKLPLLK